MLIVADCSRHISDLVSSGVRRLRQANSASAKTRPRALTQLSGQSQSACRLAWPLPPAATFRCSRSYRKTAITAFPPAQPGSRTIRSQWIQYCKPTSCPLRLSSCHAHACAGLGGASNQTIEPANPDHGVGHGSKQQQWRLRMLHAVNDSTKWLVMAAVSAALVFHPTAEVQCCIIGSVAAALMGKVWLSSRHHRCRWGLAVGLLEPLMLWM